MLLWVAGHSTVVRPGKEGRSRKAAPQTLEALNSKVGCAPCPQALRTLRGLPRQDHRMSALSVGLQLRVRCLVVAFYMLSIALLWFVRPNSCRSYFFTW